MNKIMASRKNDVEKGNIHPEDSKQMPEMMEIGWEGNPR